MDINFNIFPRNIGNRQHQREFYTYLIHPFLFVTDSKKLTTIRFVSANTLETKLSDMIRIESAYFLHYRLFSSVGRMNISPV